MSMLKPSFQLHQICSPSQYCGLQNDDRLPEFDRRWLVSHRPDAHWTVLEQEVLKARCSLWWNHGPQVPNGRAGLIGHYAAADDDSASALLQCACRQLSKEGCTFAMGPMDQNTWRDYRFVIDEGDRPRFFLEPELSPQGPHQMKHAGFSEIGWYGSSWVEDLTIRHPQLSRVRERIDVTGIRIRRLDRHHLESELKQIFSVVRIAFQRNPFYVAVSETDFLEMYRPLHHAVPSDFILLAEHHQKVVGFIFAVPDLLQAERGLPVDTLVVKTFGVLPDRIYAGLGQVLLEEVHHRAADAGFRNAIHALVRDDAPVTRIVDRYGISFRRYALFGKELK